MKLTLQLKLLPTREQKSTLLETMELFNAAANFAAEVWFRDKANVNLAMVKAVDAKTGLLLSCG